MVVSRAMEIKIHTVFDNIMIIGIFEKFAKTFTFYPYYKGKSIFRTTVYVCLS